MNRDKIDFTKTGKCCLCGAGKDEGLSSATVEKFSLYRGDGKELAYTSCRVLLCRDCAKLLPVKKAKDGSLSVKSVAGVREKVEAALKEFGDGLEKKIQAECAARPSVMKWAAHPFKLSGDNAWNGIWLAEWTKAKEEAFAEKLKVADFFRNQVAQRGFPCPVCMKRLKLAADPESLEINDPLSFACPDGHLSFDERDIAELVGAEYSKKLQSICRGYWSRKPGKELESCSTYGLDKINRLLCSVAAARYNVIRDMMHDLGKCSKCKYRSDKCDGCQEEFAKSDEFLAKWKPMFGFPEKMDLKRLNEAVEAYKAYTADKHCLFWCKRSPDNGASGVCGRNGAECSFCSGSESCRKCRNHAEGKPLGNFLATAGMCQHYKDGKCLAGCGKVDKFEGAENQPNCTYRAEHYAYGHRSNFCEKFRLRNGLDLKEAMAMSRAGKSYRGYWR